MMMNRLGASLLVIPAVFLAVVNGQGTDLGGGVITRTDAEVYADLSLDLRDIRTYDSSEAVLRLYNEGRNAELEPGLKFRLRDIGNLLSSGATLTPNYLFQLYGLAELSSNSLEDYEHYADNFIRSTIETDRSKAAEAISALSLWMYGTHLLLWGVDICSKQSLADDPDVIESMGGGGWDEFIALWIGKDQTPASSDGHGLYAWAQGTGELFQTVWPEAAVNTQLKLLYQQGAGILSMNQACSRENTESAQQLWTVAQQMISQMYVPLFQRLALALHQREDAWVALYGTALIPQTSQCRPSIYKRLNEKVMNGNVDYDKNNEIYDDLHQVLSCFGLTCRDIGSHDEISFCSGGDDFNPMAMAGYRPTTDVQELAQMDLDVLQLRVLSSMELTSFARYLYMYGKNSMKHRDSDNDPIEFLSLHELATSSKREMAGSFYTNFESYFDDENYADKAVTQELSGRGKWKAAPQRTEAIVLTSAYQILFMAFIVELKEAVEQCKQPDPNWIDGNMHPWDEVAALLIGSLEGPAEGGSPDQEDGQLVWSLGNSRAFQFQSVGGSGYAEANSEMFDLLFAGKGELDAFDCNSLQWTAARLEKVATISIVQSAIRYAILSGGLSDDSDHTDLTSGELFALSVLPILSDVDQDSAEIIERNMIVEDGVQPIQDGPQAVADAFAAAMAEWGIDCRDIGSTSQVDPCDQNPRASRTPPRPPRVRSSASSIGLGLTTSLILGMVVHAFLL